MTVRIVLVDDHEIVRTGLAALIDRQSDMELVGEAATGREAVRVTRELRPDVVVMDVGMPDLNGPDATRQIKAECPNVLVVALSMHSDRRYVHRMFGAGASGYLLKECAFHELAGAIRAVVQGGRYVSGGLSRRLADAYIRHFTSVEPLSDVVTGREREVLQLLSEGKCTKEVAAVLHVSVKTVETHRRHLMTKLGVHSIAELTKYAVREGITSLEA